MSYFTNRFFIYLCPHPNFFSLSAKQLFAAWDGIVIASFFVAVILLGYFYFFSKPDYTAVSRFWIIYGIAIGLTAIVAVGVIYNMAPSMLKPDKELQMFMLMIATLFSGAWAGFLTTTAVYGLLMVLTAIPGVSDLNWNLRAMRRFPFKLN